MLRLNTSTRYNVSLFTFYLLVEGVIGSMLYYGVLPLFFYYYKVGVLELQKVQTVGILPWSCKPLPAIISDLYPIRGKHKRWYGLSVSSLMPFFMIGVTLSTTPTNSMIFFTIMSMFRSLITSKSQKHSRGSPPILYLCLNDTKCRFLICF